jgi:hypothetical protein
MHPNCLTYPLSDQGVPVPSAAARWFCEQHEGLAEPGDLDPPEDLYPRIDFATMKLLPSKAVEEQERRQWEHHLEEQRKRDEAKRQDGERLRKLEEEWQLAHPPVFFQGVPPQ